MNILINSLNEEAFGQLFQIFSEISASGLSWPYSYNLTEDKFRAIWFVPGNTGYVAQIDGLVAGAYFIKPQWPDRGAHVATAQYMVSSRCRGQGVGHLLCSHSIQTAKELGFSSLQFNLVVSTNEPALKLYGKLGFKIVGKLPSTFDHPELGWIDTYVMHRFL
jgi:ribosomal protein S18 acetylase RimI-like enzyme